MTGDLCQSARTAQGAHSECQHKQGPTSRLPGPPKRPSLPANESRRPSLARWAAGGPLSRRPSCSSVIGTTCTPSALRRATFSAATQRVSGVAKLEVSRVRVELQLRHWHHVHAVRLAQGHFLCSSTVCMSGQKLSNTQVHMSYAPRARCVCFAGSPSLQQVPPQQLASPCMQLCHACSNSQSCCRALRLAESDTVGTV